MNAPAWNNSFVGDYRYGSAVKSLIIEYESVYLIQLARARYLSDEVRQMASDELLFRSWLCEP